MGMGRAELLLVLRARDEASRAIHAVSRSMGSKLTKAQIDSANRATEMGRAWSSAGIGMIGAGVAGLAGLNALSKGAEEYEKQAARTLTQVDGINVSLAEMKQLGFDIASNIPVAFQEIQPALYDLFSSMDLNMQEARVMIKQIARDSVAGFTSMETAGKSLIGIMNAYNIKAKDAGKVSDFMFQLVRKGVGDYDAMSAAMGKSIPSALRAGQSYEQLGGMIAFMTRNGVNAAMAGTAAARALDAMSNPKTAAKFKDIGIEVHDASGKMRDMNVIMAELGQTLADKTPAQRTKALFDLFKGSGGTIQARRFFDLMLPNMAEYQKSVQWMMDNGGEAKKAYNIASETDEAKIRQAGSAFDVLKTKIGDAAKSIKGNLAPAFTDLFNALSSIDPGVMQVIVGVAAGISSLLILGGMVATAVGGYLLLSGAFAALGISMSALLVPVGLIVAGVALLAAAGYLIYRNWSTIGPFFTNLWNTISAGIASLEPYWNRLKAAVMMVWEYAKANLIPAFKEFWAAAKPALQDIWNEVKRVGDQFMTHVWPILKVVAAYVASEWLSAWIKTMKIIIAIIAGLVRSVAGVVKVIHGIMTGDWKQAWEGAKDVVKASTDTTKKVMKTLTEQATKDAKKAMQALPKDTKAAMTANNKELTAGGKLAAAEAKKNAAAVAKALKGNPKDAQAAGKAMGTGFIAGMDSMKPQVEASARRMAAAAVAAAKKEAKITSPSKVMQQLGVWMIKGFINGIDDSTMALANKAGLAAKKVATAFNASLAKWNATKELLAQTREDLKNHIKSVQDMMRNYADVNSIVGSGEDSFATADSFIQGLETRLATLLEFSQTMAQLKSKGLNANTLSQIGAMGPEGLGFARELANATQDQIARVNELNNSVNRLALTEGQRIGQDTFLVGQQAGMGFIKGLESQERALRLATQRLAATLVSTIKRALGIRSPSRVFLEIGHNLGGALAQGMLGEKGTVAKASDSLLNPSNYQSAFNPPVGQPSGGTGTTVIYDQKIDVSTQEIDPRKHAADLGYRLVHQLGEAGN